MNEKPSIIYFANLKNSKTYKNDIYLFEQMSFLILIKLSLLYEAGIGCMSTIKSIVFTFPI